MQYWLPTEGEGAEEWKWGREVFYKGIAALRQRQDHEMWNRAGVLVVFVGLLAVFYPIYGAEVSEVCLGCICEASSGCNRTSTCNGDVCGLFRITWAYWADSGKPVLEQDNQNDSGAYARCVTDAYCAARSVRGYMAKFQQDCTGDGIVNCYDFARIHLLGGYGCAGYLTPIYQQRFETCAQRVNQLGGAID